MEIVIIVGTSERVLDLQHLWYTRQQELKNVLERQGCLNKMSEVLQAFLSTPCRKLSWMAFVIGWGVMSSSDDLKNKNLRIVILSFWVEVEAKERFNRPLSPNHHSFRLAIRSSSNGCVLCHGAETPGFKPPIKAEHFPILSYPRPFRYLVLLRGKLAASKIHKF